jgi:hypothetical protein
MGPHAANLILHFFVWSMELVHRICSPVIEKHAQIIGINDYVFSSLAVYIENFYELHIFEQNCYLLFTMYMFLQKVMKYHSINWSRGTSVGISTGCTAE